jgi:hypothetical protein
VPLPRRSAKTAQVLNGELQLSITLDASKTSDHFDIAA